MSLFIKGKTLCKNFFFEVAKPILDQYFPTLRYSAGMLGYGSDVLGYDDVVSTDHMWGPRFYLFLNPGDLPLKDELMATFSAHFPDLFCGYHVHFSNADPNDGGIRHATDRGEDPLAPLIFIQTFDDYLNGYLGTNKLDTLTPLDWISFSEHRLIGLSRAEFYVDYLQLAEQIAPLSYYPDQVWRYLLASNWSLIAEEQAFVKRCFMVGDNLGSRLACARLVERMMRLCFLYCRQYAPYSKWFGTAFAELCVPDTLKQLLKDALSTSDGLIRERCVAEAQAMLAKLHNQSNLTEPVSAEIQPYFGRDIQVIFCDRIAQTLSDTLTDTPLADYPLIGSLCQVANFTTLWEDPCHQPQIKSLYLRKDRS